MQEEPKTLIDNSIAIEYFKNIFDKTLDRDPENEELFKDLILKKGTKILYNLTKLIKYDQDKSKLLFDKAFKICMMSIFENTNSKKPVEIAFGCRSPVSKGQGYWDGAFIIIKNVNESIKSFTFDDNKDAIIEYDNIQDAYKIYKQYIKKKWCKMDIEDIKKTISIEINNNTLIEINTILKNKFNNFNILYLVPLAFFIPKLITFIRKHR